MSCHVWGFVTIAVAVYLYHSRNLSWWQEFHANELLVKERSLLQSMQDSLRGILSSIFDASCVCDVNGQLLECSPHLQDILKFSPTSEDCEHDDSLIGSNLCSFTVSPLESQRLKEFLKNATATAQHQAAKIQCSFVCQPAGSLEASLYAINLPVATSSEEGQGGLFISMSWQSLDLDTRRQEALSSIEISEQPIACSTERFTDLRDELTHTRSSESPSPDALSSETPLSFVDQQPSSKDVPAVCGLTSISEVMSLTSEYDNLENHTLASLELSESMPSSVPYQSVRHFRSTCSVEVQAVLAHVFVDAGVQTMGSVAKPPTSNRNAYFGQNRKASSGQKRRAISDAFRVTPNATIEAMIMLRMLQNINPKCFPGCCMRHRLLHFLSLKAASMMKKGDCWNWPMDDTVQCIDCGIVQSKDEEFECDLCFGGRAREALNLKSASSDVGDISDIAHEGDSDQSLE